MSYVDHIIGKGHVPKIIEDFGLLCAQVQRDKCLSLNVAVVDGCFIKIFKPGSPPIN